LVSLQLAGVLKRQARLVAPMAIVGLTAFAAVITRAGPFSMLRWPFPLRLL